MPLFRVGKPKRELVLEGSQTAGTTPYTVVWDAATSEGDWSSSDLTSSVVERPGLWLINFVLWRGAGSGAQPPIAEIRIDGTVAASGWGVSDAGLRPNIATLLISLAVGQVVTFSTFAAQTGGKQLVVPTRAALARLGPERWT